MCRKAVGSLKEYDGDGMRTGKKDISAPRMCAYIGSCCQHRKNKTEGIPTSHIQFTLDLLQALVQCRFDITNTHSPKDKHIHISLISGAKGAVLSVPHQSIYCLELSLRVVKAFAG